MNAPKPKSLVDEFYAHPTPAGAVALAAADHRAAHQFPMWEYVGELRKAETQVRAYPKLVDALRAVVSIAQPIPTPLGPPMTEPETKFAPEVEAAKELLASLDDLRPVASARAEFAALLDDFEKRIPVMIDALRNGERPKRTAKSIADWLEIMNSQVRNARAMLEPQS